MHNKKENTDATKMNKCNKIKMPWWLIEHDATFKLLQLGPWSKKKVTLQGLEHLGCYKGPFIPLGLCIL